MLYQNNIYFSLGKLHILLKSFNNLGEKLKLFTMPKAIGMLQNAYEFYSVTDFKHLQQVANIFISEYKWLIEFKNYYN